MIAAHAVPGNDHNGSGVKVHLVSSRLNVERFSCHSVLSLIINLSIQVVMRVESNILGESKTQVYPLDFISRCRKLKCAYRQLSNFKIL